MAEQVTALDSGHQIGLSTCMEDVLIVVERSSSLDFFKKSEIKADFDCISRIRGGMAKWMAAFNSAHQIGLSTCLEDVLIVVGDSSSGVQKRQNRTRHRGFLNNQRS